jgi:hypothetical protein
MWEWKVWVLICRYDHKRLLAVCIFQQRYAELCSKKLRKHHKNVLIKKFNISLFFYGRRAPQQTLQTHRTLEASCATLMKVKMIVIVCPFPSSGAPVE